MPGAPHPERDAPSGGSPRVLGVPGDAGARRSASVERAAIRRVARAAPGTRRELILEAVRSAQALLGARWAWCVRLDGDEMAVVCGEPAGVPDPPAEPMAVAALRRTSMPAAGASTTWLPILVGDRLWGALVAETPRLDERARRRTPGAELAVAEVLGAALAARRPRAGGTRGTAVERLSIGGGAGFRARLGEEVERARRYVRDLSLVLLELNHLKSVNGLGGTEEGDRLLVEFAHALTASARAGDVVGRLGGSEFGWILPETNADRAQGAAERLGGQIGAGSVSAQLRAVASGVAELGAGADADELYDQARVALTCSRLAGDGSCTLFTEELAATMAGEGVRHTIEQSRTLVGLRAMARAVDAKDPFTQRHSERVADLAAGIARALGWSSRDRRMLHQAALVHDVGKIGVPDAVLFKAGRLDELEYDMVKGHAELGAEIVSGALTGHQVAWVRGHHERWDGRGYPDGLVGDGIPEGARILALADAWDAMTTERSYAPARSGREAVRECRAEAGRQFWAPAVEVLARMVSSGDLPGSATT